MDDEQKRDAHITTASKIFFIGYLGIVVAGLALIVKAAFRG